MMGDEASEKPLAEYENDVFLSGNHLAAALLQLGVEPDRTFGWTLSEFTETYGHFKADIWIAWRAIMALRSAQSRINHGE